MESLLSLSSLGHLPRIPYSFSFPVDSHLNGKAWPRLKPKFRYRNKRPEKDAVVGSDGNTPQEEGEVVYRRIETTEGGSGSKPPLSEETSARAGAREIAPAITPLIIGFTLLLVLISLLGYLSVERMDEVSFRVLDLEHQHAAKLDLLLKLRLAVTKLNNEVRARQESDARRELKPPFDFRLSLAREETNQLLQQLERPPLSEDSLGAVRDDCCLTLR